MEIPTLRYRERVVELTEHQGKKHQFPPPPGRNWNQISLPSLPQGQECPKPYLAKKGKTNCDFFDWTTTVKNWNIPIFFCLRGKIGVGAIKTLVLNLYCQLTVCNRAILISTCCQCDPHVLEVASLYWAVCLSQAITSPTSGQPQMHHDSLVSNDADLRLDLSTGVSFFLAEGLEQLHDDVFSYYWSVSPAFLIHK